MSQKAKTIWILLIIGVLLTPVGYWFLRRSPERQPVDVPVSEKKPELSQDIPVPDRKELLNPDAWGRKFAPSIHRAFELPVVATEYFRDDNGGVGIMVETVFTRETFGKGTLPWRMDVRAMPESEIEGAFSLSGFPGVSGENPQGQRITVWHPAGYASNLWHLHGKECEGLGQYRLRFFLRQRGPLRTTRAIQGMREGIEKGESAYRFRIFLLMDEAWFEKL